MEDGGVFVKEDAAVMLNLYIGVCLPSDSLITLSLALLNIDVILPSVVILPFLILVANEEFNKSTLPRFVASPNEDWPLADDEMIKSPSDDVNISWIAFNWSSLNLKISTSLFVERTS